MRLKVDFWWAWMPKWWFFQTSFEDQTINCKQLPKVQKHTKTICFLMILRVRCFGRWKKKIWKSNETLELKLDMHVHGCLIDFGLIFKGFRTHFGPKFHFERVLGWTLGLFWAYFGIMEGRWRGGVEPDAGKSLSKRGDPGGAPRFWGQKWVCEPPMSFPKPPQRPPKSNKSYENKQSSTNW